MDRATIILLGFTLMLLLCKYIYNETYGQTKVYCIGWLTKWACTHLGNKTALCCPMENCSPSTNLAIKVVKTWMVWQQIKIVLIIKPLPWKATKLKPFTHALALGLNRRVSTEGSSKRLFSCLFPLLPYSTRQQRICMDGLEENTALCYTPEQKATSVG